MPKSKYPNKLDTSVEIPPVRDNITEIGSGVINSLRSAIFKIEAALGLNPQGAVGNTVASRISRSLDENGNILSEALDRANVLSGPIIDKDVSKVAAIQESKLKLDFPTTLLQNEYSALNSEFQTVREALEELSALFSVHVEPTALNRHFALSIGVQSADVIASDIATLSLEAGALQDVLEELYNSHINFTGTNTSALNNSHTARQIYFDNTGTEDVIFSSNTQGAIEDLANIGSTGIRRTILNIASNGRIRTGSIVDDFEGNESGSILVNLTSATYVAASGESKTTFILNSGIEPLDTISEYDILTLSGSTFEDDNKDYQIAEYSLDGSGLLQNVTVYGGPINPPETNLLIKITKNPYVVYNSAGFSCVARPRANQSNTPDVQILNPDSATIISYKIVPTNITATANAFDLVIDGGSVITIETYDDTALEQTLDSIVQKINDQCVENHLNVTAYKIRSGRCYELALAHNVPNIQGDIVERTIEIRAGSTNDGTSNLGFGNFLNQETKGYSGNSINLNGLILSRFGLIKEFSDATIQLVTGTLTLSLFSGTLSAQGVRVGDLAVITGSTNSADDGSYRIGSISGGIATLDLSGNTFAGSLDENSIVYIIRTSANIGELTFQEIEAVDGTILFDVFLTEEKDYFYSKRLEIGGSLRESDFYGVVSDVSKDFITANETATLTIDTSGFATLTGPDLVSGEPVYVAQTGIYKIFGSDNLSFIKLEVSASGAPFLEQSVTLYGFAEISSNNYHLCRGGFATSLGRILGSFDSSGIPTLTDKRTSGTADDTIIGESFIEKYIEGPRNELRASGIIQGCQVGNLSYVDTGSEIYQTFSVSAGVAIVNGIRYEYPGKNNIRIDTDQDYVVVLSNQGCALAAELITDPNDSTRTISPFFTREVATLAEVTNDGSSASATDLRLFVDNLDFKVIGDIKVSNDSRHGHFTDLSDAVAYSKRFYKMFPEMGSPSILIENGTYKISEQIIIDFDLEIKGSGSGTVLTKTGSLATGTALSGDDVDMATALFLLGGSQDSESDDIVNGITLSDFTYRTDSGLLENVGCVIALTQQISVLTSPFSTYRIDGVNFLGPATIDGSVSDPNKIGEYAVIIGQQNPDTLAPVDSLNIGNLIITNCRFDKMGLEIGAVKFTESSESSFQDIIISSNIITSASPNVLSTDAVLIEYPTTPNVSNLVEIGNTFRTQIS